MLELLEQARKVDGDPSAASRAKATAWNALAEHASPYRVAAERRRDAWSAIADAQEASHARIMRSCPAYVADKQKLFDVLALDTDVVAPADKARLRNAFNATYGEWKTELDACPAKPIQVRDAMALLPGGTFMMGGNARGRYINYVDSKDAGPAHRVAVGAFAIDVTEVSVGAYRRCVAAGACKASGCSGKDNNLPVSCIDRDEARAYCTWAKKRLPTEEEWEYAAQGVELKSNDAEKDACYRKRGPCAVGSKPSSPFGLYDMAGNVWEWTASPYTADYTLNAQVSTLAIIRGGAYSSAVPEMLQPTYRGSIDPTRRVPWVGARCARST